jgi:hypothetical protein
MGVRSTPGKGTTFTIRLPVNCAAGDPAQSAADTHRNVA